MHPCKMVERVDAARGFCELCLEIRHYPNQSELVQGRGHDPRPCQVGSG